MTLINTTKQNVDIERLKVELESLGILENGVATFKIIGITPTATGTSVDVERLDQTTLTQADIELIVSTVNLHVDEKRRRVIVNEIPNFSNEASNKKFVDDTIADLVNSAPGTLDTLNELAQALGNNANFATDITNQITNVQTTLGNRLDTAESNISNLQDSDVILGQEISGLDNRISDIEAEPPYRNISEHDDVTITTPTSGQVLKYNGSKWVNLQDNTFSGSYDDLTNSPFIPTTLNDLTDVALQSSTTGQVLTYDGTNWVNQNLPTIGIVSLNSSQSSAQTLITGTSGSDFNISTANGVHTFNIPDAAYSKRGLVTTSNQTFTGTKTFESSLSSSVGVIIRGAASQTGNLLELQNISFTPVLSINPQGAITLGSWDASTIQISVGGTGATSAQSAINNLTQVSSATNEHVLTKDTTTGNAIWKATASRVTSINSLTSSAQSIATGTTGTDFNISSTGSTHTLNLPDASAAARGVVTTGAQTITGTKTIQTTSASSKGLILKESASQTANMLEVQDSTGTALMSVDASGNINSPTITYLQSAGFSAPAGSVIAFAGGSAPSGWLLCNGSSVNTYTYRQLHAVISNTYGGSAYQAGTTDQAGAATTFTLPDLRSRAIVGMGSTVNTTLGGNDGVTEASRSLQHNHAVTVSGHYHNTTGSGTTLSTNIAHTHGSSSLTINADGGHTHSFSLYTDTLGGHGHSFDLNTGTGGGHGHSFDLGANYGGAHSHAVRAAQADGSSGESYRYPEISRNNNYNDSFTVPNLGTNGAGTTSGEHSHDVSGWIGGGSEGAHWHDVSGWIGGGTEGQHAHTVYGSVTGGSHIHTGTAAGQTLSTTNVAASGSIGKVTGGADGNIDNTYTSTNTRNHNYLILNYIIKT